MRASILRLVARRGWRPGSAHLQRIDACTDLARLEGWFDRVISATSLDEALD